MAHERFTEQGLSTETGGADHKEKKKKKKIPEKGIETWFRLASKNLYTRRQIVDAKSNILITINSIIISVALGGLYPRLATDPHLVYAMGPMVLTNLLSIAFAIFATRPRLLASGQVSESGIEEKETGLMTFDDFYRMPFADYHKTVEAMMEDGPFLYSTITRDIYMLGVDLSKRYQFIRVSYNVFLIGIVISVLLFAVCHAAF